MTRYTRANLEGSLPTPAAEDSHHHTRPATERDSQTRSYQATVEDCSDIDDCRRPHGSPKTTDTCYFGRQDSDSESRRRRHEFAASAPASPRAVPTLAKETSLPTPIPTTKEVRFSDRPVLLQRRPSNRHTQTSPQLGSTMPGHVHRHRDTSPSPLDARWGMLFRPRGEPTERVHDVLRGLALYLVSAQTAYTDNGANTKKD